MTRRSRERVRHLVSTHSRKGASMASAKSEGRSSVIAVFSDHASAEDAVRQLESNGIPMKDVSIIGKDFQGIERPLGFVTTGTVAKDGAKVGAWTGGLFGLL